MAVAPTTVVKLLTVPFGNDYKHTMDFSDVSEQKNFMLSRVTHEYDEFTYQRHERSLKVPSNIDGILDCNYVMYQNPEYYPGKWFYAFITSRKYINPHTTEIVIETDVFQTWQFEMNFKPSFVERQHTKRWNENGTPVLNTIDEGLNFGSEYSVVDVEHIRPQNGLYFLVVASKQRLHSIASVSPKKVGMIQPLSYYVHPFTALTGGTPETKIGGVAVSGMGTVESVLEAIYSDTSAVNNVVSINITEYIGFDTGYNGDECSFDQASFQAQEIGGSGVKTIYCYDIPKFNQLTKVVGNKYDGYKTVTESKLLMYPYTSLSLSDLKGNTVELKNEYINNTNLQLIIKGSIGNHNKTACYVDYYNQDNTVPFNDVLGMNNAIINNEPNDLPIITDLLSAYLQGHRNSLELKKSQIKYNQSNDIANGVVNTVSANGLLDGGKNIASGIQNFVNHEYQLASIMAKQKDISHTPPSISSLGGNTVFDYGNDVNGYYLIKRQIKDEYIDKLTDYFKMYGYKYQKVETPNYKSRQSYNYIKTVGAIIQGNIPNNDLNRIKNIFDNGVTIWHTENIGSYFLSNNEVN